MAGHSIPEAKRRRILELHTRGLSQRVIGEQLGLAQTTVSHVLLKARAAGSASASASASTLHSGKLRFDRIPALGLTAVAHAMTVGEDKRPGAGEQWRTKTAEEHMQSLLRHLYADLRGEKRDADGQLHMASVAARALMILELTDGKCQ